MQKIATTFALACALAVGACSSNDAGQSEPTESPGSTGSESPGSMGTEPADSTGSSDPDQSVSSNACPEGGTPVPADSDGPPENCNVRVDDCCFMDTDLACAAAGCEPGCEIMESYPGQIAPCN